MRTSMQILEYLSLHPCFWKYVHCGATSFASLASTVPVVPAGQARPPHTAAKPEPSAGEFTEKHPRLCTGCTALVARVSTACHSLGRSSVVQSSLDLMAPRQRPVRG